MVMDDWDESPKPAKAEAGSFFETPGDRPPRRSFGVRHLMVLVLFMALLIWLGQSLGVVALVFVAVTVLVAAIVGGTVVLFRSGRGPQEAMLWLVANAAEKKMPLPPGILAVGELCGGSYEARSRRLAESLNQGLSLSEAIDRTPGIFPAGALVYTRMGWSGNAMAEALRGESRRQWSGRGQAQSWALRIAFLIWTLIVFQIVFTFVIYWIIPKFQEIFADFGVEMPAMTRMMIELSQGLVSSGMLYLLLLIELAILPFVPLVFFDPLHWRVPLLDWWFLRRHGGIVMRVLATEVEEGRPLEKSLGRLAVQYPGALVRGRLASAASLAFAGEPWISSLHRVGLIRRTDAAVLASAERVGNLPWALRELSEAVERRFGYRTMLWGQWLFPVVILAMASVVGLYAVACFLPLVQLIEALA